MPGTTTASNYRFDGAAVFSATVEFPHLLKVIQTLHLCAWHPEINNLWVRSAAKKLVQINALAQIPVSPFSRFSQYAEVLDPTVTGASGPNIDAETYASLPDYLFG